MAGVTLDILTNLLQFSLNKLKCFSETLNSELTEEGQGIVTYSYYSHNFFFCTITFVLIDEIIH